MTNIDLEKLKKDFPLVEKMAEGEEVIWLNPRGYNSSLDKVVLPFGSAEIDDAEARLLRFAPLIREAFPETREMQGIIESPLNEIPAMGEILREAGIDFPGKLYIKMDSHLPVSGSVKARGGIYEVLKFAEEVALKEEGINIRSEDYSLLLTDPVRSIFSRYSLAVGSTGNLGLSIGIMGAKLGFKVTVHMSQDARQWKKDLLRSKGVTVIEYRDDYQKAVAEGRKLAEKDPFCHFVDDEGSKDLFFGYSVAGRRIKRQMEEMEIPCDEEHPLFVYIPCGVGGAPGGITLGLKEQFGENVHIFFVESVQAPCMTLGMMTELHDGISVRDIGLEGKTEADGLAVARPSKLVGTSMKPLVDGCLTIEDQGLYAFLYALDSSQGIRIEPSACAAFKGLDLWEEGEVLRGYIADNHLGGKMGTASHIIWATGGNMVPKDEMDSYIKKGSVMI